MVLEHFENSDADPHRSLSKRTREFLGKILADIKKEFHKEENKRGVRKAFSDTIFPNAEKHSDAVFLVTFRRSDRSIP